MVCIRSFWIGGSYQVPFYGCNICRQWTTNNVVGYPQTMATRSASQFEDQLCRREAIGRVPGPVFSLCSLLQTKARYHRSKAGWERGRSRRSLDPLYHERRFRWNCIPHTFEKWEDGREEQGCKGTPYPRTSDEVPQLCWSCCKGDDLLSSSYRADSNLLLPGKPNSLCIPHPISINQSTNKQTTSILNIYILYGQLIYSFVLWYLSFLFLQGDEVRLVHSITTTRENSESRIIPAENPINMNSFLLRVSSINCPDNFTFSSTTQPISESSLWCVANGSTDKKKEFHESVSVARAAIATLLKVGSTIFLVNYIFIVIIILILSLSLLIKVFPIRTFLTERWKWC